MIYMTEEEKIAKRKQYRHEYYLKNMEKENA